MLDMLANCCLHCKHASPLWSAVWPVTTQSHRYRTCWQTAVCTVSMQVLSGLLSVWPVTTQHNHRHKLTQMLDMVANCCLHCKQTSPLWSAICLTCHKATQSHRYWTWWQTAVCTVSTQVLSGLLSVWPVTRQHNHTDIGHGGKLLSAL